MSGRRILIVTMEMLPGCGYPTAGGGVRAWSLGKALEGAGHEVVYALHDQIVKGRSLPEELTRYAFSNTTLDSAVACAGADLLVFEQWFPLTLLGPVSVPVVLDLPGPLILENHFRKICDLRFNVTLKLKALAKADFFLYATERQRWYWLPWLILAGVEPDNPPMAFTPISLSPDLPDCQLDLRSGAMSEARFIQAGIFWPWRNPYPYLKRILSVLDLRNKGELHIHGGRHPYHKIEGEQYLAPEDFLTPGARWKQFPMCPMEELFDKFRQGGVAVDLAARNVERDLSSAVRDIGYLWTGLPLVVWDYSYLAPDIKEYEAGWVLDSEVDSGLEETIEGILDNPSEVIRRGENAQALARAKYTWDVASKSLSAFCERPRIRVKQPTFWTQTLDHLEAREELLITWKEREESWQRERNDLQQVIRERDTELLEAHQRFDEEFKRARIEIENLAQRLSQAEHDLDSIRSKRVFKIYKRLMKLLGD